MKTFKINVPDSFQAYLVEGATFTKNEEYPILKKEMISKDIPQQIMPFNKAITYRGDLSNTFICFYSPDATFERVRKKPKRYLNFFKRTAGIIGFDFSIHSDMQIVKQKQQMNDNLSLTYFYANHGIPVIPNIRCGIDELIPEFLETIPKNSIIAIGTHGFIKTKVEKYERFCFLETILKELNPSKILVYGPLKDDIFEIYKKSDLFIFYEPWITKRFKEVTSNGN